MQIVPQFQFLPALIAVGVRRAGRPATGTLRSEIVDGSEIRSDLAQVQFERGSGLVCLRIAYRAWTAHGCISLAQGILHGPQQSRAREASRANRDPVFDPIQKRYL